MFGCAVTIKGDIYCWGDRSWGTLGDGDSGVATTGESLNMGLFSGSKVVTDLTVAFYSACALQQGGAAYCWGYDDSSSNGFGAGSTTPIPRPVVTTGMTGAKTFLDLKQKLFHTCGVSTDNKLYCWGYNAGNQLGEGTTTTRMEPYPVDVSALPAGERTFVQATVGYTNFSCGLNSNGKAYCWGTNTAGYLGTGNTTKYVTPQAVDVSGITGDSRFTEIISGGYHSCARTVDERTFCWGPGANGRLGNNSTADALSPVSPDTSGIAGFVKFTKLTLGLRHTCGITQAGVAYCWGKGTNGALGNNDTADSLVPVAVDTSTISGAKTFREIQAGEQFTCGITTDHVIYCWGLNSYSQLGDGGTTEQLRPVVSTNTGITNIANVTKLSLGLGTSCALSNDGSVKCWGDGTAGQMGSSPTFYGPVKVDKSLMTGTKTFTKVAAGAYHACGLTNDKKMYCWGANIYGAMGTNTTDNTYWKPTLMPTAHIPGNKNIIDLALGYQHTCALMEDQQIYCTGWNADGQLGDGTSTDNLVLTAIDTSTITGDKNAKKISAGWFHTCAIMADEDAYCWGWNNNGQLGTGGGTTNKPAKVLTASITGSKIFSSIRGGRLQTCALMSDGDIYCFGYNSDGRLGVGDNTGRTTPTKFLTTNVTGSKVFTSMSTSEAHTCARTTDSVIYCTGYGPNGQLANGSTTNQNTPVLASSLASTGTTAASVTTSVSHTTYFLSPDGKVFGAGWGRHGQLGVAPRHDSSVFIQLRK